MPTPPKFLKKVRQFFAWSFSRFCDYRECPAKAAYKHIDRLSTYNNNSVEVDKLVEGRAKGKIKNLDTADAMTKGSVVHSLAERFTKGRMRRLPAELATFKKEFIQIRKHDLSEEKQWAFNASWEPVAWFAREAWLRVMVDQHYNEAPEKYVILDYKTGKAPSKPDAKSPSWNNEKYFQHEEQREIYAIAIFIMYPDAVTVSAKHWYVDAGVESVNMYERGADFERLKKKWAKLIRPMMNDRSFAPRPSPSACKFCDFKKSNGGPCKY